MKKRNSISLFIQYHLQNNKVAVFLNVILFIIVLISLNLNIFDVSYNFKVGDIAPFTVIAHKDMDFVDSVSTELKKRKIRETTIPVFDLDMTIYQKKLTVLEEIFSIINQTSIDAEEKLDALNSKINPLLKEKKMDDFSSEQLLKYEIGKGVIEKSKNILFNLYQDGIYKNIKSEYDISSYVDKFVSVRVIEQNGTTRDYRRFNNISYLDLSYFEFFSQIKDKIGKHKNQKQIVDLLYLLLEDNLYINTHFTNKEIEARLEKITPTVKTIKEDEHIVRKGDKVNQEIIDKVRALKVSQKQNFTKRMVFTLFFSFLFIVMINIVFLTMLPALYKDLKKLTLVYLFLIFNVLLVYLYFNLFAHLTFPLGIIFPIGFTVYTLAIIMDRKIAILVNIMIVFIVAIFHLIYRLDSVYSIFYILIQGILMNITCIHVIRRDQIIQSSFYMVIPYLVMTGIYTLYFQNYIEEGHFAQSFFWSALNPVISAVLSIGLIPVFEKVFNMATPFRLMELNNLSNKVLSDMHLLAPGTYQHSILVSHLVESACKEIGADYFLARVGAVYHDIGKLSNPKYFSENINQDDENIHEEISPQFSASILKSHVIEGVRMAKEMGLPDEVIQFIPEHHGSSVMEYFYNKAKDYVKEGEEVDLVTFSYGGEKPKSKETAILMLADSVEAGVRSLKSKRYDLIEDKIAQIFSNRINNGDLSDANLTLRDLKKIEVNFRKLMFAYYHVRPSYPVDKDLFDLADDDL